jgi:hypothetical protein
MWSIFALAVGLSSQFAVYVAIERAAPVTLALLQPSEGVRIAILIWLGTARILTGGIVAGLLAPRIPWLHGAGVGAGALAIHLIFLPSPSPGLLDSAVTVATGAVGGVLGGSIRRAAA